MSATQRYFNPPLGNNGPAIYSVGTGSNCGVATGPVGCPSGDQGALWNWNFYIDVAGTGGTTLGDYQVDLYYDLDPAGPNSYGDLSGLGKIDITQSLIDNGAALLTVLQDSQNNMFPYLEFGAPNLVPRAVRSIRMQWVTTSARLRLRAMVSPLIRSPLRSMRFHYPLPHGYSDQPFSV